MCMDIEFFVTNLLTLNNYGKRGIWKKTDYEYTEPFDRLIELQTKQPIRLYIDPSSRKGTHSVHVGVKRRSEYQIKVKSERSRS